MCGFRVHIYFHLLLNSQILTNSMNLFSERNLCKYVPSLYLLQLLFCSLVLWNVVMFIYLFPPVLGFKPTCYSSCFFCFISLFSMSPSNVSLPVSDLRKKQKQCNIWEKKGKKAGDEELSEWSSDRERCVCVSERARGKQTALCQMTVVWRQCVVIYHLECFLVRASTS